MTGQEVANLSADFASCIDSRALEDDAMVNFRMDGGAVGRLWTSAVAVGRQHGLAIQVFGEKGGLRWAQEQPNQLYWTPVAGGRRSSSGRGGLSPEADRTSRLTVGHAEGMALPANITDLAEAIRARKAGRPIRRGPLSPGRGRPAVDGTVHAAVASARDAGAWVDACPPLSKRPGVPRPCRDAEACRRPGRVAIWNRKTAGRLASSAWAPQADPNRP